MGDRIVKNDFARDTRAERELVIEGVISTLRLTPENPRSEACACLSIGKHLVSLRLQGALALADALLLLAQEYESANETF